MRRYLIVQGPRPGIMVDGFRLNAKVVQNGHVCIRVVPVRVEGGVHRLEIPADALGILNHINDISNDM